ncbi:Cupredoxin [Amylocarpus encephaloides]|uniref:Cupredoxin n=1 Tax=Amylocarpus encephaloides TaxID=45428 RepID=A0A9P7YP87_9HELO|nr:Cupredoxin [Amylocarpus encephaloides]
MQFTTINVLALASAVSAATIKVTVGQGGLVYTPSEIKAAVGDEVEFSFFPKNHTVSQASFAKPCEPLEGGFFSGFVPTPAPGPSSTTFTITVKDTKPVWIYCGQTKGNHCQSGMVAAINAPTEGKTLAAFAAAAKNSTTINPSGGPVGGVLKQGGNGTGASTVLSTSSYSTTVVGTTTIQSAYTSNGVAYTTAVPSVYTSVIATASVATSISPPAATSSVPQSGAAAPTGAVKAFVAGAALLAAALV